MHISSLSHQELYRKGSSMNGCTTAERYSADFLVDGQSLLQLLTNTKSGQADYMGCFVKGYPKQNNKAVAALLLKAPPETASGRVFLYTCPECGDIGCGAYTARVSKTPFGYVWESFAYENGYEEPEVIESLDPIFFEKDAYEEAIHQATVF